MAVLVIGIDCATLLRKVGMATSVWDGDFVEARVERLHERATINDTPARVAAAVADVVERSDADSVLLALDAPLGWPEAMHDGLPRRAGAPIPERDADRLFRRETDRVVEAVLGRRVLEVGANLIARTAFMALRLLDQLRFQDDRWRVISKPEDARLPGRRVVEVYPAGTALRVLPEEQHRLLKGYKADAEQREKLRLALARQHPFLNHATVASDHDLDALLAVVAAGRVLREESPGPTTREQSRLAALEGWIWL